MESVCEDLRRIIPLLLDIGLEVEPSKSDVSIVSCDNFQCVLLSIESALPGVTVTQCGDIGILAAPIDISGCRTGVLKAVERLSTMSSRQESIDAHPAFFRLLNCLSMPRIFLALKLSILPNALRTDSSTKHCGKRLPRFATPILTIPGGKGQHFPSLKVVLVSPRQ